MKPRKYNAFTFVLKYIIHVISETNIAYHNRVSAIVFSGGLPSCDQRTEIKKINEIFANAGIIDEYVFRKLDFLSKIKAMLPLNHDKVNIINVIFSQFQIILIFFYSFDFRKHQI